MSSNYKQRRQEQNRLASKLYVDNQKKQGLTRVTYAITPEQKEMVMKYKLNQGLANKDLALGEIIELTRKKNPSKFK